MKTQSKKKIGKLIKKEMTQINGGAGKGKGDTGTLPD